MDRVIFEWINHWPSSLSPIFVFFSEATKSRVVQAALLLLIVALLTANEKTRKTVILAMVAWPLANGLTDVLKHGFQMNRPYVDDPHGIVTWVKPLTSYGTASAHAANMACIAFVFTYYL